MTSKTRLEKLMDLLAKCFLTKWIANILFRKWVNIATDEAINGVNKDYTIKEKI